MLKVEPRGSADAMRRMSGVQAGPGWTRFLFFVSMGVAGDQEGCVGGSKMYIGHLSGGHWRHTFSSALYFHLCLSPLSLSFLGFAEGCFSKIFLCQCMKKHVTVLELYRILCMVGPSYLTRMGSTFK